MKHMRVVHLVLVISIALFLVGCSAVKEASTELDMSGKTMKPPAGQSLIYVVRPTTFGFAVGFDVFLDNNFMGTTGGSRYIYAITAPGKHTLKSVAENDSYLELATGPDTTYYVRQNVNMGILKARNELQYLLPEQGRRDLMECKLSSECAEIMNKQK